MNDVFSHRILLRLLVVLPVFFLHSYHLKSQSLKWSNWFQQMNFSKHTSTKIFAMKTSTKKSILCKNKINDHFVTFVKAEQWESERERHTQREKYKVTKKQNRQHWWPLHKFTWALHLTFFVCCRLNQNTLGFGYSALQWIRSFVINIHTVAQYTHFDRVCDT